MPANNPARSHPGRPPCARPRTRAIVAAPIAAPKAYCSPANAGTSAMWSAPATVGINAGVPGRAPTNEMPWDAPTRAHHRYTGSSGPTPNGHR